MLGEVMRRELTPGASVLDLCTGSGMLAVMAARHGAGEVVAVDISRAAMVSVALNAFVNRVRVRAVHGDLFEPVHGRRFDLIVSNPPYLPGDVDALPRRGLARATEGGRDGRAFLDRICREAGGHLTRGGSLLLVHSTVCGEHQTLRALCEHGLEATVALRRRGPLGPVLSARAEWLRRQGMLLDGDQEEILVIKARAPARVVRGGPEARQPAALTSS